MTEQQRVFTVPLTEEEVLFLGEMGLAMLVAAIVEQAKGEETENLPTALFGVNLKESTIDVLRSLLREPLRNSLFREAIKHRFERHPIRSIRVLAWPLLEEHLVWEIEN